MAEWCFPRVHEVRFIPHLAKWLAVTGHNTRLQVSERCTEP